MRKFLELMMVVFVRLSLIVFNFVAVQRKELGDYVWT